MKKLFNDNFERYKSTDIATVSFKNKTIIFVRFFPVDFPNENECQTNFVIHFYYHFDIKNDKQKR